MAGCEAPPLLIMRVYTILKESPYKFRIPPYTYYFSTNGHVEKFKTYLDQHRKETAHRLAKRYKVNVDCPLLSDMNLYCEIENRGFYIKDDDGREYTCQQGVKLNGQRMTLEKSQT